MVDTEGESEDYDYGDKDSIVIVVSNNNNYGECPHDHNVYIMIFLLSVFCLF